MSGCVVLIRAKKQRHNTTFLSLILFLGELNTHQFLLCFNSHQAQKGKRMKSFILCICCVVNLIEAEQENEATMNERSE
jgi:hypothetical protein